MSDFDNTNRGALFENDRKQTENHPDLNGKLNIDGTEFWISAWRKQGRNGEFLSLSLGKPVEQRQDQGYQQNRPAQRQQPQQPQRRMAPSRAPAPRQPMGNDRYMDRGDGFSDMDDSIPY